MTSMSQSSAGGRGTLPFKAPELFSYPPVVSAAADVYAFGILAWVVVAGEQPYASMEGASTALPSAVDQGVRPELENGGDWRDRTNGSIAKLIEKCWSGEQASRPAFGSNQGGGGEPIVKTLEKLELSGLKYSDNDSNESMVTRLISSEAEAEKANVFLAVIDEAVLDAGTIPQEMTDLEQERTATQTNAAIAQQNAHAAREQITQAMGADVLKVILASLSDLSTSMKNLQEGVVDKVKSHEISIGQIAQGELDVPRLFVLLPVEKEPSLVSKLLSPKSFVQDRYRLDFLDPVTGYAARCGPKGIGYEITLPQKWIADHQKDIVIGIQVLKITAKAGRLAGLPLPNLEGLPTEVISKAEVAALRNFEAILEGANDLGDGMKVATGQTYRELRQMLKNQCNDENLIHCNLSKERAADGTIEFVTKASRPRFLEEGARCLVWRREGLN